MQIHWTHFDDLDPDERGAIESRLRGLTEGHSDLIDVRLVAQSSRHHRHGAREVRITCQARGREIVASREREDMRLALDEALDAFEHEVHRLRERRRDLQRSQPVMPPNLGIVDRVMREQGYGFVLTDAGEQVYFHRNALCEGLDFDSLEEGRRVSLSIETGEEGLQASAVLPAPPDAPSSFAFGPALDDDFGHAGKGRREGTGCIPLALRTNLVPVFLYDTALMTLPSGVCRPSGLQMPRSGYRRNGSGRTNSLRSKTE